MNYIKYTDFLMANKQTETIVDFVATLRKILIGLVSFVNGSRKLIKTLILEIHLNQGKTKFGLLW